ncbi:outer membrane beta-barrel protein [Vibrio cholerae]|uniref:outer membrane beta-barrel protein n=1 Tax=Vibrio cholerae TaxID=666 RepID=UPI0020953B06|nr:outer membrane beta-barrel protein [Vibrio cholerae]MCO7069427.1 porin family protein [Vibrio cholerae]
MKKTLLALALLGASSTAMADSWIYGGASVGQSDYEGKHGTAYSVHAGTGILPFIGLEAGYVNHGDFEINATQELSASSLYFAVKPSMDFGPLHVYAKGGLHSWDKDINGGKNDDGIDVMYGIGAEYFIMGPFSVGASYMNYTMDSTDVGTLSFNATFHFL